MSTPPLLAWRLARRELRGGIRSRFRGFRIFLACLALGTAAIAAVGSISSGIETGLGGEARALLGGDVELRIHHRPATEEQRQWLAERGRLSEIIEVRAMARHSDGSKQRLVELKAVDDLYPLVGELEIQGGGKLAAALAPVGGLDGAVVAESLLEKLGLSVGDRMEMGDAEFRIVGVIAREPDRATRGVQLGPRVIVTRAALDRTGLLKPGSLSQYLYRITLPAGAETKPFIDALGNAFPDAPWRVRDPGRAAPGLLRFVNRLTLFLTLVGLSALLIGGVGVGNAVGAFLTQRRPTIATLKCLGAPAGLVLRVYLLQVLGLAAIGIAGGLVVGAAAPVIAAPLLSNLLPVSLAMGLYPGPLLLAAAFGIATTLVFSLPPLMLARDVPAAAMFRQTVAGTRRKARWLDIGVMSLLTVALMLLTVLSARDKPLAIWFVIGASAAFLAFRLAAAVVIRLARAAPRSRRPRLRLAVANLHRPGTPTPSVVLSLGLGITVLVAIMMIERNLDNRIDERHSARSGSTLRGAGRHLPRSRAGAARADVACPDYRDRRGFHRRYDATAAFRLGDAGRPGSHLVGRTTAPGQQGGRGRMVAGELQRQAADLLRQGRGGRVRHRYRRQHDLQRAWPRDYRRDRQPARDRLGDHGHEFHGNLFARRAGGRAADQRGDATHTAGSGAGAGNRRDKGLPQRVGDPRARYTGRRQPHHDLHRHRHEGDRRHRHHRRNPGAFGRDCRGPAAANL
jgi:predicted lysophospholipase L1 biosynthesis ABC-type transport system permease subunit